MLKTGNVVNEWLKDYYKIDTTNCCGIVSCLNAWPISSTRQHLRSISVVLMVELKIDRSKIGLIKLLIATAAKHVERANKKV